MSVPASIIAGAVIITAAILATAAAAETPKDRSTECGFAVITEYNRQNLALLQTDALMSIETQILQRRLQETYCLKLAHCLVDGLNGELSDLPLRAEFAGCLREEAAEK
jgi:hypothetical protein